jgi:ketosteroid isomerase-like protein
MPVGAQRRESEIQAVLALVRQALESGAIGGGEAPSVAASVPGLPVLEPGERLTATDLLGWWFRPPQRQTSDWDGFFGQPNPAPTQAQAPLPAPGLGASPPGASSPSLRSIPRAWTNMRPFLDEEEVKLADDRAEAATECLYEFLHAVGRRDLSAAMACVADDYHVFENERETNKSDLLARTEAALQSLYGWQIEVGLTTVPEPVFHPMGVLIYADIQVNAVHSSSSEKRSHLDRRIVLLQEQADGHWRISAFSPIEKPE